MKKILFILCLFGAFVVQAQKTPQTLSGPRSIGMIRGEVMVDSASYLGIMDTTFTPRRVGGLVFRAADSSYYYAQSITTRPYWVRFGNGGGTAAWGNITGTLSSQTDLQNALNAKQNTLTLGTSSQIRMGDHSLQNATSLITSIGDPRYSQIGHLHTSANISDFTTAARSAFSAGSGISITDGVISATASGGEADSTIFATRYFTGQTYSPLGHTHNIGQVIGLQDSLNTRAFTSHVHNASTDITTGTLPIARGGTGRSTIGTAGQLPRVDVAGTGLEYFTPNYATAQSISDSINSPENTFIFSQDHFGRSEGAGSAPDTIYTIGSGGTGISTEDAQDAVNTLLSNGSQTNVNFSYDDNANALSLTVNPVFKTVNTLHFKVGTTTDAPTVGASFVKIIGSQGYKVNLFRNGRPYPETNFGDGYYYFKRKDSDTLFLYGLNWTSGEEVTVQFYDSLGVASLTPTTSTESIVFAEGNPNGSTVGTGSFTDDGNWDIYYSTKRASGNGYLQFQPIKDTDNGTASMSLFSYAMDDAGNEYRLFFNFGTNAYTIGYNTTTVATGTLNLTSQFVRFVRTGTSISVQYASTEGGSYTTLHTYTQAISSSSNMRLKLMFTPSGANPNGIANGKISGTNINDVP